MRGLTGLRYAGQVPRLLNGPCAFDWQECGILDLREMDDGKEAAAAVEEAPLETGHRVLVFAQLKALLDIVERDLLQPSGVPFLRLDGR